MKERKKSGSHMAQWKEYPEVNMGGKHAPGSEEVGESTHSEMTG